MPSRDLGMRVWRWACHTVSPTIARHQHERALRVLEETLELIQVLGIEKTQVLKQVDYTYSRPEGNLEQEVGGVGITLHVLAAALGVDVDACVEDELEKCWKNWEKIRMKAFNKPQHIVGFTEEEKERALTSFT